MKAIVCDKCGKVTLIEDDKPTYSEESGVFHLIGSFGTASQIDLCKDCAQELMAAVRERK